MHKGPGGLCIALLAATLAAVLALATPASARDFVIAGEHVPAANRAQGLVLEGQAGNTICADGQTGDWTVRDSRFGADGTVVGCGPYPDCMHEFHYHGVLFNSADPDPGHCGWGEAVPSNEMSFSPRAAAEAITDEWLALDAAGPRGGRTHTDDAIEDLHHLRLHFHQHGGSTERNEQLLADARELDHEALDQFIKALNADTPEAQHHHFTHAHRELKEALVKKRALFKSLNHH